MGDDTVSTPDGSHSDVGSGGGGFLMYHWDFLEK